MTSYEVNAKASFRHLRDSLKKEQPGNDIELGHSSRSRNAVSPAPPEDPVSDLPKSILSQSSLAKDAFRQLFATIQEKRYDMDPEKREVYEELMDHLDEVEETHRRATSILVLAELLAFSGLLSALLCSLKMERIKHQRFLRLRMWQYIAMVMMIVSGLSVVRFVTFVVSWPVKRWWRVHKYALYLIRELKRCVDVTLWFCIVLTGWYLWFRLRLRHVHGELSVLIAHQVTQFLIALCLGSFLWLLKNVLYLKLEADLHYDQLFERVQLSVVYLHFLQIIHNRGMWRFLPDNKTKRRLLRMVRRKKAPQATPGSEEESMYVKGVNIWMLVGEMDKGSVPIWILRRLEEEYLDQVKLRPLPGNSNITKDDQKILREAKKMFRQLIKSQIDQDQPDLADHYCDFEIRREDLEREPYSMRKEELDIIFKYKREEDENEVQISGNETSGHTTISYDKFLDWAVRAFKNCWGLEQTLNSSKRVFIKLNRLLSAFLLTVMLIIWLLLSGIVDTGQLALLFTPFLAASFIFGDSCKKMFEGLIFAFAMHPFDVGDRVIINNVQMRVTELNILTSCFHKYDTGEEVIAPNSTLTTTNIINLDITPDQSDKIEFLVSAQTPLEDIKDLEIKITKFLDDDIEYASNNKVVKSEIGNEGMKMVVYFKYLVSYLTAESKALHKSKILSMIIKFRKDMEMNKREYPSSYEPYAVEIDLKRKVKLKDIEDLQSEIFWDLREWCGSYSKVVVTELKRLQVKMDIYINITHKTKDEKEDVGTSHQHQNEKPSSPWKTTANRVLIKKNLHTLCESLKRNGLVQDVSIRGSVKDGKSEVIGHGGIVWPSFKARDVIQTQDNPTQAGSSLETVYSGVESQDHGNLFLAAQELNEAMSPEANSTSQGN